VTDLTLFTLAFLVAAVFVSWVAIRTFQRERPLLFLLIPALLGMAAYSWAVVDASRGFPTRSLAELDAGFLYLWHGGENPVYLLAVPEGAAAPRLYETTEQMTEEARRGMAEAEESAKRNVPTRGRLHEGEWVFHSLNTEEERPKADASTVPGSR
jgi:hypothetical protein